MENQEIQQERDKQLWKQAKDRVKFKSHLLTYLAVNAFFWAVWYFTDHRDGEGGLPWPVFPGLGWGFGLFFHFLGTYVFSSNSKSIEKEYEKLKKKENK